MKRMYKALVSVLVCIMLSLAGLGLLVTVLHEGGIGMDMGSDENVYRELEQVTRSRERMAEKAGTIDDIHIANEEAIHKLPGEDNPAAERRGAEESSAIDESSMKKERNIPSDSRLFMTFDEVSSIVHMGPIDKLVAMSILVKLDRAQLDRLVTLANDGITQSEYSKMKEILDDGLPARDVTRLLRLVEKNRKLYAQGKLD